MTSAQILVVEDQVLVAENIRSKLQELGYEVPALAVSGEEAIEKAAEHRPDLVLMDIKLKGEVDGIAAATQIRDLLDIPVVYLTAYADPGTLERAKVTSPFGYVLKPFAVNELRTTIEMALYKHDLDRQLEESEARYRAIVEDQTELLCRFLKDGTITFVNDAYCRYFDKQRRELVGDTFTPLVHPKDRDKVEACIASLDPQKSTQTIEHRVLTPDGEVRWQQWTNRAIFDERGHWVECQAVGRDVTERVQAEQALQRRNRELKLLNEASRAFSSTLALDQVLATVLEEMRHLLDVSACSVWLTDQATGELVCRQATGPKSELVLGWRLAPGEGLAGHVAQQDHGLIVSDIQSDARHFKGVDQKTGLALRSMLTVPLRVNDQVIGVLQVVDTEPGRFTPSDLALLEPVATSAAIALQNAGLYEQAEQEIARRRKAEETLRQNEQRFRLLYDNAPLGYQSLDEKGRFIEVNQAWLKLLGYSREQVVGRSFGEFLAPEGVERFERNFSQFKVRGEASQVEYEMVGQDGSHLIVSIDGRVRYDEQGSFQQTHCILHDVTKQKEMESALQTSQAETMEVLQQNQAWLQSIFEAAPVGIGVAIDRVLVQVNDRLCEMLGYSQEELLGQSARLIYPTDRDYEHVGREKYRQIHEQGRGTVETRWQRKDGEIIDVLLSSTAIDPTDLSTGVTFAALDITARKQVEAEHRKLSHALEQAGEAVFITDSEGTIQYVNPAFARITGYEKEEVLGKTPRILQSGEHNQAFYQDMWQTILAGRVWQGTIVNRTKSGQLYHEEMTIAPMLDESGAAEHFVAIKRDITSRVEREAQSQKRSQELAALYEISQTITSTLDLQKTLTLITEHTTRLMGVAATSLLLHDEARGDLWFAAGSGEDVENVLGKRLPMGQGIAGWVAQQGEPALVPNVAQDTRWFSGFDQDGDFVTESILCVPLQTKGRTIGSIEVMNKKKGTFDEDDLRLLSAMAAPAATAIENAQLFDAAQRQLEELTILHAVAVAATEATDEDTLIERATEIIGETLYTNDFGVALVDKISGGLRPHPSYRCPGPVEKRFVPLGQGISGQVAADGQPRRVPDVTQESHYVEFNPRTRSELCVPLKSGERVLGVINAESDQLKAFTEADERLLMTVAGHLATAIEKERLFEAERVAREQLQALSRRLVEVQEAERRHIARELHDETGQALSSLLLGLSLLERQANQPEAVVARATDLENIADAMLENLHRLAMNLRPASLDHLGLVVALRQYLETFDPQHGLTVQFEALGLEGERLPPTVETALYRIVQEALTNVIRHAQATRVDVLLERRGDTVVTIVEDNGVGFDPDAAIKSSRLGLFGMQERAEMLGGTLTIESAIGKGTTVLVEVPYDHSDSNRG